VNQELYQALKGLIAKAGRGRGVENYSLAFKVGKRLIPMRVSAIPYPLTTLGESGVLLTLSSKEEKLSLSPPTAAENASPQALSRVPSHPASERFMELADPWCILDASGRIRSANQQFLRLLNMPIESLQECHLSSLLAPGESRERLRQIIDTARRAPWRGELLLRSNEGKELALSFSFQVLREGETEHILAIARDFTELHRLWRQKQRELERVWTLLDKTGVPLLAFSPDLRITFLNHEATRMFPLSVDRAVGMSLSELMGKGAGDRISQLVDEAQERGGTVEGEITLSLRRGEERILRIVINGIPGPGGSTQELICWLQDVTAGRRAEIISRSRELRLSLLEKVASFAHGGKKVEDLFQEALVELAEVVEAETAGLYLFEGDYAVIKANLGISEEFLSRVSRWKIRPNRIEIFRSLPGAIIDLEEGKFPSGLNDLKPLVRDWDRLIEVTMQEGLLLHCLIPLVTRERTVGVVILGNFQRPRLAQVGMDTLSQYGSILGMIMEQLEILRQTEEQLHYVSKSLDFKNDLLRMVSHEMEAPLTYIQGYQHLLKKGLEAMNRESLERALEYIELGCERMTHIKESLQHSLQLDSLQAKEKMSVIKLDEFFRETVERMDFLKDRYFFYAFPEPAPSLGASTFLLGETIHQLLYNVHRLSPPGAQIEVIGETAGDEFILQVEFPSAGGGKYQQSLLFDDMDREKAELFQERINLDMYLCKYYAKKLGGELSIYDRPQRGKVLTLRLPLKGKEHDEGNKG
jgi:PAS domain S-box-containing protein